MKHKLGNYIIAAFFLNVFAIMSVGGVCIIMVKDMVNNISALKAESSYISRLYELNNSIQDTIFLVHNPAIELDKELLDHALSKVEQALEKTELYREEEIANYQDKTGIRLNFEKIGNNLQAIQDTLEYTRANFTAATPLEEERLKQLKSYGYNIQNLMGTINTDHFANIDKLVNQSYTKMYYILFLYLVSSMVGIMASVVGYIVLSRNTIAPIIDLANATEKVASGDLGVRVKTGSHTEIGTLYNTFNLMTEKLEEHKKQRENFRRELEKEVEERTAELKASEESLRQTQAELVRMEKIATLGQIASSVNHEIKTPLNVLYMNLQMLNKKINTCDVENHELKQEMLDITNLINNEIDRINEIIEEFVKYARFPAPDFQENNINDILAKIGDMISQKAEGTGVSVDIQTEDRPDYIMVDDKKLTQAILNLCTNAIDAMPEGGSLTLKSRRKNEHIILTVTDTGKGIPSENLEHIFEPFFTQKEGGTGFGLSIVKRIIEDHKGQIYCHSEPGKGTTFEIILPALSKDEKQDKNKQIE